MNTTIARHPGRCSLSGKVIHVGDAITLHHGKWALASEVQRHRDEEIAYLAAYDEEIAAANRKSA